MDGRAPIRETSPHGTARGLDWALAAMREIKGPKFMSVRECANELSVSIMTVYRLINSGEVEAVRVNSRTIRVYAESWRKHIDSNRIVPGTLEAHEGRAD
jgi:excisionase family DNA binding protein